MQDHWLGSPVCWVLDVLRLVSLLDAHLVPAGLNDVVSGKRQRCCCNGLPEPCLLLRGGADNDRPLRRQKVEVGCALQIVPTAAVHKVVAGVGWMQLQSLTGMPRKPLECVA